ncbi:MAG: glutaminyl-peptide cyclotransferase [Kiritimatiellia bacterium]
MQKPAYLFLLVTVLLGACRREGTPPPPPVHQPRILRSVPHNINAFTQGILSDGPVWLESTGQYGQSDLREVDRESGKILRRHALPPTLFGEGLTLFNAKLYQLTWREGLCLIYDRNTFEVVEHFRYEGEGWGLTSCEQWLYMSNGSDIIQVRDPASFQIARAIAVHTPHEAVTRLNELEWIAGEIWANIFMTQTIVRINPANGRVIGFVNLDHLPLPGDAHPEQDVLNGIAYDPADQSIWVTGKNWSKLYQIAWPPEDTVALGSRGIERIRHPTLHATEAAAFRNSAAQEKRPIQDAHDARAETIP